ncbi:MAG: HWE histidine kinase domain-containing protein [Paracoccaceae bacterium]
MSNSESETLADQVHRSVVLGRVQSFACVIAVGPEWTIIAASKNCSQWVGQEAEALIGQAFGAVFHEETAHKLRSPAQFLSKAEPVIHLQRCPAPNSDALMDVTVTRCGPNVLYELEPAEKVPGLSTEVEQMQRLVRRVSQKVTIEDAAMEAARTVRAVSGLDRVSVHRVGLNGLAGPLVCTGSPPLSTDPSVLLTRAHAGNPYQHLHIFPDIKTDDIEVLVSDQLADLEPQSLVEHLSCCKPDETLRSALQGDGARAAMIIPIRRENVLWGVFVCHHSDAYLPSVGRRSALALFTLLFGYELERLSKRRIKQAQQKLFDIREALLQSVSDTPEFLPAFRPVARDIATVLPSDGMIIRHLGQYSAEGLSVPQAEFEWLFSYLHKQYLDEPLMVERLSDIGLTSDSIDPNKTAMMAIPISRASRDFLLLFRALDERHARISVWQDWEYRVAQALRAALVEVQLKIAEDSRENRQQVQERQGLLIAELNHRVRNILNLIHGLMAQGRAEAATVEDYANVLEARVHALSSAHDQLTENDWSWVNLRALVEQELEDFLGKSGPKLKFEGDAIDLSPAAFTTLALVLHELVTNAAKYGALSVPGGTVTVQITARGDGFVDIVWREQGGPIVSEPMHKGFGLTIIEQSVPFELRGTAAVAFTPDGLTASFALPGGHVRLLNVPVQDAIPTTPVLPTAEKIVSIDGVALVLDDSLIISIDAASLLKSAGATDVYSCNSVDSALNALDAGDVTFALLDVNLGAETSLAVAEQLWNDGIPAVLATGYGANEKMLAEFPPMPVLTKPYTLADLQMILRSFSKDQSDDEA